MLNSDKVKIYSPASFTNDDNKDYYLYRIISFSRVVSLYKKRTLPLVNPLKWNDPYEHNWTEYLKKTNTNRKIVKDIYGVCMSEHGFSDAMWSIYSPDKLGIRLKINPQQLLDSLKIDNKNNQFYFGKVKYLTQRTIKNNIVELSTKPKLEEEEIIKQWYKKRNAFSYEKEVRLLCVNASQSSNDSNTTVLGVNSDPRDYVETLNFDSRLNEDVFEEMRDFLMNLTGLNKNQIRQSSLYKPFKL